MLILKVIAGSEEVALRYVKSIAKCACLKYVRVTVYVSSDGSRNLKGDRGSEGSVSAPSYFIANAHNELYIFHMGKGDLLKKF